MKHIEELDHVRILDIGITGIVLNFDEYSGAYTIEADEQGPVIGDGYPTPWPLYQRLEKDLEKID